MKNLVNKIKSFDSLDKVFLYLKSKGLLFGISNVRYIKIVYRLKMKQRLNLDNPKSFNEKIQWLKFNWFDPLATKCADKYEVRNYIEHKIGKQYLNDLLGVYENPKDIDFQKLPNKFVIKVTHSSGYNIICNNKVDIDWERQKSLLNRWLKRNYYDTNMEWVYRDIKPRIIVEKFLEDKNFNELIDYKVWCFNGVPKFLHVVSETSKGLNMNYFDLNWNEFKLPRKDFSSNPKYFDKPQNFENMIRLSEKLSKPFPFVRVDWYEVNNKLVFGELTFFPTSGFAQFINKKDDLMLGSLLELPIEKEIK